MENCKATTIKAAKMFPLVGGQYKSLDVLIRVDTQIRLTHMKFNCSETHQSVTFGLQQTIQRNEKLPLFWIFKQARSHNVKYLLKLTSFLFFMSLLYSGRSRFVKTTTCFITESGKRRIFPFLWRFVSNSFSTN